MRGSEKSLRSVIDSLADKDAEAFRLSVRGELMSRVGSSISSLKKDVSESLVSENLTGAPSAPPVTKPINSGDLRIVPTAAGAAKDDISLDPNFEKEYFQSSMLHQNQRITVKQVGTGLGKPVRIYINDRRWELFPGPKVALKSAKEYIDGMLKDVRKDPSLGKAMTAQIQKDKAAGVAQVAAPVDAGKPHEVAAADMKRKELETGKPAVDDPTKRGAAPPPRKPPAPKPPTPPKQKPTKEVKPK